MRVALAVATGLAIAGCSYLGLEAEPEPPDDLADMFGGPGMDPECRLLTDDAELLAEFEEVNGGRHEWWAVPTAGGGRADVVVEFDAGGNSMGSSGGMACNTDDLELQHGAEGLTWTGGGGTDAYVTHGGRAPAGSAVVRMTFRGHPPVDVEVANGVYFTVLNHSAAGEWSFPDKVEAFDDDGNLLATWDGSGG